MPQRAGDYHERIRIEAQVVSGRKPSGEQIKTWARVLESYANVTDLSGAAAVQAQALAATASHEVRLRYRDGIKARMRAVWLTRSSRILLIEAVLESDRRRELRLFCREAA